MKKKIKIIFIPILIITVYVLVSIFLSPTSSFVKLQYVSPVNKEEAKDLGVLITDNPKISFTTNSNQCEDLEFWVSKNKYFKMYGMLPIGYHIINEDQVSLHMTYPVHLSQKGISVKFEGHEEMIDFPKYGISYNSNSKVHITIIEGKNRILCELDVYLGNATD